MRTPQYYESVMVHVLFAYEITNCTHILHKDVKILQDDDCKQEVDDSYLLCTSTSTMTRRIFQPLWNGVEHVK